MERLAINIGSMQTTIQPQSDHHYYFVTGKLAQVAMREVVARLAAQYRFSYSIGVLPITVAALMTPRWLRRHWEIPSEATHVIVPGYLSDDADPSGLMELGQLAGVPLVIGPKDCRDLAELFGQSPADRSFDQYQIEIIAEINHVPRHSITEVVATAEALRAAGADIIDVGGNPAAPCNRIGDYVQALIDQGHRVSIDSFDADEVVAATRAGAELVLSVNSTNRQAAADWGCEVVAIPDSPDDDRSFHETIECLIDADVTVRLDPILEPIGCHFAASLVRYAQTRNRYPRLPMMMGIGNLTELTDADSAGINLLLLGICQELEIYSVLTTQVVNWARSSVRECDLARRIVHYSHQHGIPPKRLSDQLVMLRDTKLRPFSDDALDAMAASIRDHNYRIHAQNDTIHLLAAGTHLADRDPFQLFDLLMQTEQSRNINANHAFYLGFELAKASLALQLGKQYEQDQSLDWGYLTEKESNHRLQR